MLLPKEHQAGGGRVQESLWWVQTPLWQGQLYKAVGKFSLATTISSDMAFRITVDEWHKLLTASFHWAVLQRVPSAGLEHFLCSDRNTPHFLVCMRFLGFVSFLYLQCFCDYDLVFMFCNTFFSFAPWHPICTLCRLVFVFLNLQRFYACSCFR